MGFLISNCLEYSALSWSCVPLRCKGSLQGRLKECSLFTLGLSPGTSIGSEEAVLFPRLSFLMALLVCHNQGEVDTVDWRRQWHPTQVLLPGKSHGWRSLVGCSPWGREESDTTERLHFHFSLSCIGEGNGNPLQCSCLENPRDRGAWWAAVYGVAQSRTRLKRLSSSSSRYDGLWF